MDACAARRAGLAAAGSLVGLLLGCVHRVEVVTVPAGANLYRAGAHVGEAPSTVAIRPFATTRIEARLPGYRTAATSLRGQVEAFRTS